MTSGALERLQILAFKKPDFTDQVGTFEAFVNPSEITLAYEIQYDTAAGAGTTGSRMDFNKVKAADLTLSFFFDGTGANGRVIDVQGKVEEFQTVTGYDGEIHRTRYLKIGWGTVQVRRCVLKSASIAYKLFKPDGTPLRAVINATFTDATDDQTRVARQQDSSPDLTHVRVLRAGDTLPALCNQIYGDPHHYLVVARANGFDGFRDLPPGTRVRFPPLPK